MHIAIIGCGLIGRKRATALSMDSHKLVIVADIDAARAEQLVGTLVRLSGEEK